MMSLLSVDLSHTVVVHQIQFGGQWIGFAIDVNTAVIDVDGLRDFHENHLGRTEQEEYHEND